MERPTDRLIVNMNEKRWKRKNGERCQRPTAGQKKHTPHVSLRLHINSFKDRKEKALCRLRELFLQGLVDNASWRRRDHSRNLLHAFPSMTVTVLGYILASDVAQPLSHKRRMTKHDYWKRWSRHRQQKCAVEKGRTEKGEKRRTSHVRILAGREGHSTKD